MTQPATIEHMRTVRSKRVTPLELSRAVALLSRQHRQAGAYLRCRARLHESQIRVSRGQVLDAFIATRSYARAATACGVSRTCVRDLIRATIKYLEGG